MKNEKNTTKSCNSNNNQNTTKSASSSSDNNSNTNSQNTNTGKHCGCNKQFYALTLWPLFWLLAKQRFFVVKKDSGDYIVKDSFLERDLER